MRTLHDVLARSVRRHPDAAAVDLRPVVLTYRDLDRCAAVLAADLHRRIGGTPARIGLLAGHGLTALAGYLAILRLGATVVPLNPDFPDVRNRRIADLAGVGAVLADADRPLVTALGEGGVTVHVVPGDALLDTLGGTAPPPRVPTGRQQDTAYLLFTSGSTGRPKGVPIGHRQALSYLDYTVARCAMGPGDRASHTFDLTFDPSVFDLFAVWGSGATLVVPGRGELLSPIDHVVDRRVTHWYSVPSVVTMSATLGTLRPGAAPGLRRSAFIGEPLSYDQAHAWAAAAPNSGLENVYGPTELTVSCAEYQLASDQQAWPATGNGSVPIGTVSPHLEWVLLDGLDVASGPEGELAVRGDQRFDGYADPDDDRDRFRRPDGSPSPGRPAADDHYRTGDLVRVENGLLVHLGRLDDQVKVSGYRIELGEIETALRATDGVHEAVVVAATRAGRTELVAYYTGRELPGRELTRALRSVLPIYLVPGRFEHLTELPYTANGKTDRSALRSRASARPVPGR